MFRVTEQLRCNVPTLILEYVYKNGDVQEMVYSTMDCKEIIQVALQKLNDAANSEGRNTLRDLLNSIILIAKTGSKRIFFNEKDIERIVQDAVKEPLYTFLQ